MLLLAPYKSDKNKFLEKFRACEPDESDEKYYDGWMSTPELQQKFQDDHDEWSRIEKFWEMSLYWFLESNQ